MGIGLKDQVTILAQTERTQKRKYSLTACPVRVHCRFEGDHRLAAARSAIIRRSCLPFLLFEVLYTFSRLPASPSSHIMFKANFFSKEQLDVMAVIAILATILVLPLTSTSAWPCRGVGAPRSGGPTGRSHPQQSACRSRIYGHYHQMSLSGLPRHRSKGSIGSPANPASKWST